MDSCLIRGRIQANLVPKQNISVSKNLCLGKNTIYTDWSKQKSGLFLLAVCNGGNFKRLLTKIVTSCSIELYPDSISLVSIVAVSRLAGLCR